jgi:hypothetical protein
VIANREDLLSAIRRADLTPQGLEVGPLSFVKGRSLRFGKVTDEAMRRALITKVKLAASKYFTAGALWEIPCSEETSSSNPSTTPKSRRRRG